MFTESNYIMWYDTVWGLRNNDAKEKLLAYFGSAEEIWLADSTALSKSGIANDYYVSKLADGKKSLDIAALVNKLYTENAKYISRYDEGFPQKLMEMNNDMPLGIYVKGDFPLCGKYIGIVGARRCTEYGKYCCMKIAGELAQNGICVISGMAVGTDSNAHIGCLDGGGKTIAVFGTGIDVCYPAVNRSLMGRIISSGCVITEYPFGTCALPYNFPYRNRLISALSDGVVFIESAEKSGTLITAEYAAEQGKELFALPGNITGSMSVGTNNLIKNGMARCITDTSDILSVIGASDEKIIEKKKIIENFEISLATDEKMVYDCIDSFPLTVDEIAQKLKTDMNKISFALTMLELKGLVSKLSGQKYVRCR